MNSIRVFLVSVSLAVILLCFFIAALRGYQASMHEAQQLLDTQLMDTAILIGSLHAVPDARSFNHDSSIAFQVWRGGELVAASASTPPTPLAAFEAGFDDRNFDGHRWRTASYPVPGSPDWVLVADRAELRIALAENVILSSLRPLLLSLPFVGLLIWLIVTRGLRPLRLLADELALKRADNLGPLAIDEPRRELVPIIESSNALLARLESTLQREREFASDAAHELRTPISALRLQVDNLVGLVDDADIGALGATTDRLEHIVEQILDLYRSTPEQLGSSLSPLCLGSIVRETVAERYPDFERKEQVIEFEGEDGQVQANRFALKIMLNNLLSNANRYTPRGGRVQLSTDHDRQGVTLVVEDSGPGIPESMRQDVFNRFHRGGRDRHDSGVTGCGLGLAIVKRLADVHAVEIQVADSETLGGCRISLAFPAVSAPSRRTVAKP